MFPRGSGVLLHITSLPSPCGIGDLGPSAYVWVDMLRRAQQTYWQVLPLNPTSPGSCNSPYISSSSIAGNPLLISPELLVEEGLLDGGDLEAGAFPSDQVDFDAATAFKTVLLDRAWKKFRARGDMQGLYVFCQSEKAWLDDFALFTALKRRFGNEPWNRWPDPLRRRRASALAKIATECREEIEHEKWRQFVFARQWAALKKHCRDRSVKLIGDIPIYVGYDSVDVWAHPDMFKLDDDFNPVFVSGVPPDYFSATGQLWNNPVYKWDNHAVDNFSWWTKRLTPMFERFDIVRIDHFRGLVKYWEIPAGATTAINGSWQPVPTYALFDALRERIPGFPVIAEDLGIITDDVREAMTHYDFPGMKVLLFAFGNDDPNHPYLPHTFSRNSIVYPGTHDNNTVRGWYEQEAGEADRERLLRYAGASDRSSESVVRTMIRLAQGSVADVAVISAQDALLLGGECRMNRPAIAEGNWKWRMTPAQMREFPTEFLAEMARVYGRVPG